MFVFNLIFISIFTLIQIQNNPHGKIKFECFNCHTTDSWKEIKKNPEFNHSNTNFILLGSHANVDCKNCHKNLKFNITPLECFECHTKDYDNTIFINHRDYKFSTDCKNCHSEKITSWKNSFDHSKTEFRLEGAHIAVACFDCHKIDFRPIKYECLSCHENNFNSTTDPNHKEAGFSTECIDCHRPVTWKPATNFAHENFFPIDMSSRHNPGVWNSCKDCHQNPASYKFFECINCHEHNRSDMDRKHDDKNGYVYASVNCYACHPNGEED